MNKTWKTHPSQLALKNHWKKQSITINYTTTTMNCSSVAGKSPLHLDVREVHQRLGLGFV